MENLRYPIGRFQAPTSFDCDLVEKYIHQLSVLPPYFAQTALELSPTQLKQSYRPEGWNAIQIVHHLADSHMNAFIRFKLALTETEPNIKPYQENLWSNLPDSNQAGISSSLQILSGLHYRWVLMLKNMSEREFMKSISHPEYPEKQSLFYLLSYYAWHAEHHLGHLKIIHQQKETQSDTVENEEFV